jgi:transposase
LGDLELYIVRTAKAHDVQTFSRLQSVPGIGKILALVILYEIRDIVRFPRVQDFLSYSRLVKGAKESAGNRYGRSGTTSGNPQLQGACSAAAVLFLRQTQRGQEYFAKLERNHGQGTARTVLAQKLARALYYSLPRHQAVALTRFVAV